MRFKNWNFGNYLRDFEKRGYFGLRMVLEGEWFVGVDKFFSVVIGVFRWSGK